MAIVVLGATLAITTATGAEASPGNSPARTDIAPTRSVERPARPDRTRQEEGGEYVVSFDADDRAAAVRAIEKAGGVVVDVQEPLGLALVETKHGDFADEVDGSSAVSGVVQNQSIGATRKGMAQVRATERLTVMEKSAGTSGKPKSPRRRSGRDEPLENLQWDMEMIGATRDGAHRTATGERVTVGIIDTGVDASHPDIAPNFNHRRSRNFTHDIPAIDGPCDTPTCIDPADVDEGGHGTHVAGTVGAARNRIGITGVAPDASIVNVRAGQDSGYFFFYETVSALLYAGDAGLDVVNMSFYTDPWLYNCASEDDYISGEVTEEQIAEQAMIRRGVIAALEYAHDHGVTLVAAAGNSFTNLALPTREDATSPDYPPGTEGERVVTNNCLDLPAEGPHVLTVSAVGPSGTKSDFSNYGNPDIEVSAPGGWFRDGIGTPSHRTAPNLILSSYPWDLAVEEGLIDEFGEPTDEFTYSSCNRNGCAAWTYLQGTSMASPHVAGEAALVVEAHGKGGRNKGKSLHPNTVSRTIMNTATDHACPAGGIEIYTDEGRTPDWNAVCEGTTDRNGLYGEGIIDAEAAVAKRSRP
jgi:subtilisin family serine protease